MVKLVLMYFLLAGTSVIVYNIWRKLDLKQSTFLVTRLVQYVCQSFYYHGCTLVQAVVLVANVLIGNSQFLDNRK